MTRKKSNLWLNKPKRVALAKRGNLVTPLKSTLTPKQKKQSGSTKRKSSSRNSTPKRQRIFSPYLKSCSPLKASPRKPRCSILHHLVDLVLQKLEALGMDKYFISFLTLIEGKFPLNNLSFLLFLETVRFFSNQCTTEMRYFPETKRFWRTGYRLFHDKFLYYMGGPKM